MKTKITYLLFFLFVSTIGNAQKYFFRQYTMYDGLAQQQITALFQDSRGYLWVGTKGGLSKFNGVNFESFRTSDGLPHPFISDIEEDFERNIWVSTPIALAKFDGISWVSFEYPQATRGFSHLISIDDQNNIWLTNREMSNEKKPVLSVFDGKKFTRLFKDHEALNGNENFHLSFNKSTKKMWISSDSLGLFKIENGELIQYEKIKGEFFRFRKNGRFKHPTLLVGRAKQDFLYQFQKDDWIQIAAFDKETEEVSGNSKNEIVIKRGKHFLFKHDIEAKTTFEYKDLKFKYINTIFFDNQDNLWLATEEGLIHFFGETFLDYTQFAPINTWNIYEDKNHHFWFSGYLTGIRKFDGKQSEEINSYRPLTKNLQFHPGGLTTQNGEFLFPMTNNVLSLKNGQFSQFAPIDNTQDIYENPKNEDLWFAARNGFFRRKSNGTIQKWGIEQGMHQHEYGLAIHQDSSGMIWIGTDSGLSQFDPQKETFENYTRKNGKLDAVEIKTIFRDNQENLWLGGRNGLFILDYKTQKIKRIAEDEITLTVNFLIDFDKNNLLIGAINGLYIFDLKQYYRDGKIRLKLINKYNGWQDSDPIQNGVFKDSNGDIWVPGRSTLVKLQPDKLDLKSEPLRTFFTNINGQKIGLNAVEIYPIQKGENTVKIEFEAVGFDRPMATKYKWRFSGKKWSDWQKETYSIFSNLSSGEYLFEVKAKTVGLEDSELKSNTIRFKVSLPFWEEPYFNKIATGILGLFFALILFNWIRQKRLRAIHIKNKKEVEYLRAQMLQTQLNPHFISNALMSVKGFMEKESSQKASVLLVKLAKLLRGFLESTIKNETHKGFSGKEADFNKDPTLNLSTQNEIRLDDEIDFLRKYLDFEQLMHADRFDFEIILATEIQSGEYRIPPMILQPFVENAVKHGVLYKKEKGMIRIEFRKDKAENLVCIIEDDGIGRAAADKIKSEKIGTFISRGTDLVEHRRRILNQLGHHILIDIQDRKDGGTIVQVIFGFKT